MLAILVGDPAQAVVRGVLLAGIMGMVGASLFAWRVVPSFTGDQRRQAGDGARRLAQWAGVLTSLAIAARLVQQSAAFADAPAQWTSAVPLVIGETTWGTAWLVQALALPAAMLVAPRAWRGERGAALALGVVLLALCATPALSGHAIGAPRLAAVAVALDTVHVIAAGAWIGTLAAIAVVALPVASARRNAPPAGAESALVRVLARFSPIALASAVALATTGAWASWLHLETVQALWTTDYGRMLLRKLVLLAGVAAAGAYNWRVNTPRVAAGGDPGTLRRSVAVELALAAALVAVTAVLVATPLPADS